MLTLKKNYASLESKADNLYELTEEDIKRMHEVLLEMYDDLFEVCEKNSIKMLASGGTALGTIRHQGFIPWDDDMDLHFSRSDYETFIKIFEKELGEKYEMTAPGYKGGASCFMMRVYKKNTTLLNMMDEASPYPHGIYIDITPIDYAPENRGAILCKGFLADLLRFISYSVYWHQYRSKSLREFMINSEGKNYYKLRMMVGAVFSFQRAEKWFAIFNRFIQGKKSRFITIAAGRKKYRGELLPIHVFYPPKKAVFENREIYVVNKQNVYLKHLYGDYMKIPPKLEREKHLCLKLDFEKSS